MRYRYSPVQRKEAFKVVLEALFEVLNDLIAKGEAEQYNQLAEAILAVTEAVHGPPAVNQLQVLCEQCWFSYARCGIFSPQQGCTRFYCAVCFQALRDEEMRGEGSL